MVGGRLITFTRFIFSLKNNFHHNCSIRYHGETMGSSKRDNSVKQDALLHNIITKLNEISEDLSELNDKIKAIEDEIDDIDLKLLDLDDISNNITEIEDNLNELRETMERTYTIVYILSYMLLYKYVERLKDSYKAEKIKLRTRINDMYFDAVLEAKDRIVLVLLEPYIDVEEVRYCSEGMKKIKQLVDKTQVDCIIIGLHITRKGRYIAKRNGVEVILVRELP